MLPAQKPLFVEVNVSFWRLAEVKVQLPLVVSVPWLTRIVPRVPPPANPAAPAPVSTAAPVPVLITADWSSEVLVMPLPFTVITPAPVLLSVMEAKLKFG